jgi:superfamily II DNA or RNA helicase
MYWGARIVNFSAGTIVRLRNNPSCAGQITGETQVLGDRVYWRVRLADGSGFKMLPAAQLEAEAEAPDPIVLLREGRFCDPGVFRRLLIHHRLTGRLRDVIYSMDVTDTEFHAYQFKPVIKLLASPSQGLLIADEVGLGKTIEAGLIWTELVARFDACRMLVICPKSLTEKWRQELWQKFSVDAKIVDAGELLQYLQREVEGGDGFALIASLPAIRPPSDWNEGNPSNRAKLARFLVDREGQDPLIDCLIFDEAHHLRNADTVSHAVARRLMDVADYKLLLSATPINLHREDLRNLLQLIDPDTFEHPHMFEVLAEENQPLVAARENALNPHTTLVELVSTVRDLPRGKVLKIDRQLDNLIGELGRRDLEDSKKLRNRIAAQLEEMSLLGSIVNRTRRRDVNDLKVERRVNHHRWKMTEDERAFYELITSIVREHAWTLNASELFLLATPQRLISSSLAAACSHWQSKLEDVSLDDPDDEAWLDAPLVSKLANACSDVSLAAGLEANDTKFHCLMGALRRNWLADPNEKIIVFSSFKITLDYLAGRLAQEGVAVEIMHGGVKEERSRILTRFQTSEGSSVLLTSEVGGEGLDIQFCRSLINYDLPWNPMKVEQRIGRIDRIGQKSPSVSIVSLISAGTIEERIYERLYQRLLKIEETLGSFEAILGSEIAGLEQRLLDPNLTEAELAAEIDRRALAIEERYRQERQLEEEAPGLIAHGDMILDRIEENHRPERQVRGEDLADYVHEALANRFPGSRIDDVPGELETKEVVLSAAAHHAFKDMLNRAGRVRTRLNREMRIRAAFGRFPGLSKSVERISTVHPLVRFAAELRKEAGQGIRLQPVVSVAASASNVGNVSPGIYVSAIERWSVEGAVRVDRLAFAAANPETGRLDPQAAEQLIQGALREGIPCVPEPSGDRLVGVAEDLVARELNERFKGFAGEEEARHYDRADTGLARLAQQHDKRIRDAEWKLSEWKRSNDPKKLKLIPAEQGKLQKLLARLDHKQEQLEEARERFAFQRDLVGLAIIDVRAA